ncbi:MAG: hypothetical protein J5846_04835 [Desulfovibrio sp.]|nr:hypothetical protein [Desulfovibrio sp.]
MLFGLRFLVGLAWYPLEKGEEQTRASALFAGLVSDCAVYACGCLGLGRTDQEQRARLSLAGWLGSQMGDAVLLLPIRTDDNQLLYWLFVKWRGRLLAGYADNLYASLEEGRKAVLQVQELFSVLAGKGGTQAKVLVAETLEESQRFWASCSLPSVLSRLAGRYAICFGRLPPYGIRGKVTRLLRYAFLPLLLALGFVLLYGGMPLLSEDQASSREPTHQADLSGLFGEPWQEGFSGRALQALLPYLDSLALDYQGWRLTGFEMVLGNAQGFWQAHVALHYTAGAAAQYEGLAGDYRLARDGQSLERQLEKRLMPVRSEQESRTLSSGKLASVAVIERRIWQWQRDLHLKSSLHFAKSNQKLLPGQGRLSAPWQAGNLSFVTLSSAQLTELLPRLSALAGFVLKRLSYAEGRFSLEGVVYASLCDQADQSSLLAAD